EHFAPQPVDAPGAAQLSALRVEGTLAEDVQHRGPPSPETTALSPQAARAAAAQTAGVCVRARAPARSVPLPPRRVDMWTGCQYTTGGIAEKYPVSARKIPASCQDWCVLLPYSPRCFETKKKAIMLWPPKSFLNGCIS